MSNDDKIDDRIDWRAWGTRTADEIDRLTELDDLTPHQEHRRRLLEQQLEAHYEAALPGEPADD